VTGDRGHLGSFDGMIQPVTAQQQHIAWKDLDVAGLDIDKQFGSKRPAQDMAGRGLRGVIS